MTIYVAWCPTGCGRETRPGHLMCGTCWHEVPRELQCAVTSTWRTYSRLPIAFATTDPEANTRKREARLAYQRARDAAIDYFAHPGPANPPTLHTLD